MTDTTDTTAADRDAQRLKDAVESAVERVEDDLETLDISNTTTKKFNGEMVLATVEARRS